jgi:hemerythrin
MGTSELLYLCEYLESYVIEHFDLEEKLMYDAHYPHLSDHRQQHSEFRTTCKELSTSCRDRGADKYLAIDIDKKMRKWWENHILKLDLDYVPYIKNVSPDKL